MFENTIGTTSACAENTYYRRVDGEFTRNYLRVRGEYATLPQTSVTGLELPPRARRIRNGGHFPQHIQGTTSACAENTL